MSVFKINNLKLSEVKNISFSLEKELQDITEKNLDNIFNLEFVSSEFKLNNFRIDTVAFDREINSFVIIEYKKNENYSVIDQGYSYLSLMLNNKADFILEYNEKTNHALKKNDVDWSQSKVLFISSTFTPYQRNAIGFKDLPIEIWEVKKYDNGTIFYNQLKPLEAIESIKIISKNKTVEKVNKEIREYSFDDIFKKDWIQPKKLFDTLREDILEMDERIGEKINKFYIGYKIGFSNVCTIKAFKSKLEIELVKVDKEDLKDPENKIERVPWQKYRWGKFCSYTIKNFDEIDYGLFLIKQVYEKFYK
jgi:predicted transport protein